MSFFVILVISNSICYAIMKQTNDKTTDKNPLTLKQTIKCYKRHFRLFLYLKMSVFRPCFGNFSPFEEFGTLALFSCLKGVRGVQWKPTIPATLIPPGILGSMLCFCRRCFLSTSLPGNCALHTTQETWSSRMKVVGSRSRPAEICQSTHSPGSSGSESGNGGTLLRLGWRHGRDNCLK